MVEERNYSLNLRQRVAIEKVASLANNNWNHHRKLLRNILQTVHLEENAYSDFCQLIRDHATIALHFHPDRILSDGYTVIEGLIRDGVYKNQFETGISSGSLYKWDKGRRHHWEDMIFKGAYHRAKHSERPKYGALNLTFTEDGPSPRFGSCFFLLCPELKVRATFSYGDTHLLPQEFGTITDFDMIMAVLFKELLANGKVLGIGEVNIQDFVLRAGQRLVQPMDLNEYDTFSNNLDAYIEAQVHGDIVLSRDVEVLVADRSFKDTFIGDSMEMLCESYGIGLSWNSGRVLRLGDMPLDFWGAAARGLAEKMSKNGMVNAFLIGEAAKNLRPDKTNIQLLKYVWHGVVRYGGKLRK